MGSMMMRRQKATIYDIAKMAGVSIATVSMVLNKKDKNISEVTRQRILRIADELRYIPNNAAKILTSSKSGTLGVIVPDIVNPFFSYISRAVEDSANHSQYNVILCNSDNDIEKEHSYLKLLLSKQVDGVVLISGGNDTDGVEFLKQEAVPFVLVDRYIQGYENELGVYCDNQHGIMMGVDYLYLKGKRNIAFVNACDQSYVFQERHDGFISAMRKYGIFKENHVYVGELSLSGGMKITKEIIRQLDNIDAIFYCADIMALGGIKTLMRNNISVPGSIGVIGFDNIPLTEYIEPELTTISQPIYQMGITSSNMLIDYIHGKVEQKRIVFEPKLIVRGTA
jgi:LacI family transcriptional regulator